MFEVFLSEVCHKTENYVFAVKQLGQIATPVELTITEYGSPVMFLSRNAARAMVSRDGVSDVCDGLHLVLGSHWSSSRNQKD